MGLLENIKYSKYLYSYGGLLTEHQYKLAFDYFNNNLSLTEIAENYKLTKQAVADVITRVKQTLDKYEETLALSQRMEKLEKLLEEPLDKSVKDKIMEIIQKQRC